MDDQVLVFADGKLLMSAKTANEIFPTTDPMIYKGELIYVCVTKSSTWYQSYTIVKEEDVPSVYRTLKLMLTN